MNSDLPTFLKEWYAENVAIFEGRGALLKDYESPINRDKCSYGISLEYSGRIMYVTVWNSGELQISSIDLDVDDSPKDEYQENPSVRELLAVIQDQVNWIFGSSFS